MAIVILGGLVTSTLLNLFIIPSLYLRFAQAWRETGARCGACRRKDSASALDSGGAPGVS